MTSYIDKLKRIQQHGVLFHKCKGWDLENSTLICTQTGWTFFKGNPLFLKAQLMRYNIPVAFEFEGPAWENPIPNWPQVSFEEANRLRDEYNQKYDK